MSYGGDVTPAQCHDFLKSSKESVLIDVRTQAEWSFVGLPNLENTPNQPVLQQWQQYPQMSVDPEFVAHLTRSLEDIGLGVDAKLYFLCRSGGRSLAAAKAMTAAGYEHTYNITGGFEGDPDENGHRGATGGWEAAGLPWRQT